MKIHPTSIAGVYCVNHKVLTDTRGAFYRLFCSREFNEIIGGLSITQTNVSMTSIKGTFRGFHLQLPPAHEYRLVSCLKGEILDYAIDLRRGSATFLGHVVYKLGEGLDCSLLIPPGIAHGFQSLQPDVLMLYHHTGFYAPSHEVGFRYDDPRFGISFPLPISVISERDQSHQLLSKSFDGIEL